MRRLASSLLLATTVTTAAFLQGAAVFASDPGTSFCLRVPRTLEERVEASTIVVIARVTSRSEQMATLEPEAYLKGPISSRPLAISSPPPNPTCPNAPLRAGSRVLAIFEEHERALLWPEPEGEYALSEGRAVSISESMSEATLLDRVRAVTGQYAVPAVTDDEGEGIEWGSTVLPIAVALGVVFVIGLFLMRIWHRIDPS